MTIVQFNVTIIDDDVSEGNEYLMLRINDSTLGVLFGSIRHTLITILDDDFITGVNSKLLVVSYLFKCTLQFSSPNVNSILM